MRKKKKKTMLKPPFNSIQKTKYPKINLTKDVLASTEKTNQTHCEKLRMKSVGIREPECQISQFSPKMIFRINKIPNRIPERVGVGKILTSRF